MADDSELVKLFISIGVAEAKANETVKNKALAATLKEYISEVSFLFVILRFLFYPHPPEGYHLILNVQFSFSKGRS
jgi:hypothetical protein